MRNIPIEFLAMINVGLFSAIIYFIKRLISKLDLNNDSINKINLSLAKMSKSEEYTLLQIKVLEKSEEKANLKLEELQNEIQECSFRISSIESAIAKH